MPKSQVWRKPVAKKINLSNILFETHPTHVLLLGVPLVVLTKRLQHPHHNVVVHLEEYNVLSGHPALKEKRGKMRSYPDVLLAPTNEKEALPHLEGHQK